MGGSEGRLGQARGGTRIDGRIMEPIATLSGALGVMIYGRLSMRLLRLLK